MGGTSARGRLGSATNLHNRQQQQSHSSPLLRRLRFCCCSGCSCTHYHPKGIAPERMAAPAGPLLACTSTRCLRVMAAWCVSSLLSLTLLAILGLPPLMSTE